MNLFLPRPFLLMMYTSFVRHRLDYSDVIYDQSNSNNLAYKIETFQYNAALAITGAIMRTSKKKLYQESGLQTLKDIRWLRQVSHLYKIVLTNYLAICIK